MAPRRPASKRLLKVPFILTPKTETADGQGGRTFVLNSANEIIVKGTELHPDTEEFVDVLGPEVADRGVYLTHVDPSNGLPVFEDTITDPFENIVYEIHRVEGPFLGLVRLVLVKLVESR